MPDARDPRAIEEAERRQQIAARDQLARDARQFSTPEGRRFALELTGAIFLDVPEGLPEGALREWVGRRRAAKYVWDRLQSHPDLFRLALHEHAQRAKQEKDEADTREAAAVKRRELLDRGGEAGDFAP